MTAPVASYLPIVVHVGLVALLTAALLGLHALLGRRRPLAAKLDPYESGVWPIGTAREPIPVRYYLIAMLFLLFDLEILFLYPWAVTFRTLGAPGLWGMAVFLLLLAVGFLYEWGRGGLEWE